MQSSVHQTEEQRCSIEAKEEWSLKGFLWHTLGYKM